jgi:hypothetical protein
MPVMLAMSTTSAPRTFVGRAAHVKKHVNASNTDTARRAVPLKFRFIFTILLQSSCLFFYRPGITCGYGFRVPAQSSRQLNVYMGMSLDAMSSNQLPFA